MLALRRLIFNKPRLCNFAYSNFRSDSSKAYEEVRIPVPWGHIAGKWWGPQDKRPILTIHGWQDNCGSFDLLIPLMPSDLSYLAIDLPGHGYSSRLPPGMFYHGADFTLLLKRIQEYFHWEKVSLIGHSLGAICAYTYGMHFPECIDFAILIDGLHPLIHPLKIKRNVRTVDEFIKYDAQSQSSKEPPSYTFEEMEQRLHKGTRQSIDLDKCRYILARNIRPSSKHDGKYYFGRDPRLKCGPLMSWSLDDLLEASKRITFPLHVSKAELSPFFDSEAHYPKVLEVVKAHSKDCVLINVPGQHHGHLNQPDIFKDSLPEFIRKHDIEDRTKGAITDDIRVENYVNTHN